jgi:uncharacterized membrane protein YphA (DoxX/SURF4 family)
MPAAQNIPLYYIAILRIAVGYHFLQTSLGKLNPDFYTGNRLVAQLANVAADPIGFHRAFITDVVIPNKVLFAYLVSWGEFLIGLSLIAGCLVRVSAAFAWFHNLNIYLAIGIPNGGAQLAINRLYLVVHLILIATAAGRSLGLDGWLHKRFPKQRWF